jgi:hypothetical protein
MPKFLIFLLAINVVIFSILLSFLWIKPTERKDEALYLLEVLREIVKANEVKMLSEHKLLEGLQEYPADYHDIKSGQRYLWFTMSSTPVNVMNSKMVSRSKNTSFFGYFIVVNPNSYIVDFGWHKPWLIFYSCGGATVRKPVMDDGVNGWWGHPLKGLSKGLQRLGVKSFLLTNGGILLMLFHGETIKNTISGSVLPRYLPG